MAGEGNIALPNCHSPTKHVSRPKSPIANERTATLDPQIGTIAQQCNRDPEQKAEIMIANEYCGRQQIVFGNQLENEDECAGDLLSANATIPSRRFSISSPRIM
jgi:hypothetical protein